MENPDTTGLWICPDCGARLATKNLYHTCGTFMLEELFARSAPETVALARRYVELLRSLGDVQILPQKTRVVCGARVRFATLSPLKNGFPAVFTLRRWVESTRLTHLAEGGPHRRMHRLLIESAEQIDDELRAWLQEAHDTVGLQS
jgi:hypothetical protein